MAITLYGFFCSVTGKYFLINVDQTGTPVAVIEVFGNIFNALVAAGMPTVPAQC